MQIIFSLVHFHSFCLLFPIPQLFYYLFYFLMIDSIVCVSSFLFHLIFFLLDGIYLKLRSDLKQKNHFYYIFCVLHSSRFQSSKRLRIKRDQEGVN